MTFENSYLILFIFLQNNSQMLNLGTAGASKFSPGSRFDFCFYFSIRIFLIKSVMRFDSLLMAAHYKKAKV